MHREMYVINVLEKAVNVKNTTVIQHFPMGSKNLSNKIRKYLRENETLRWHIT